MNSDKIKEALKKEFEYVGSEQISGVTAFRIISDVLDKLQSQQKHSALKSASEYIIEWRLNEPPIVESSILYAIEQVQKDALQSQQNQLSNEEEFKTSLDLLRDLADIQNGAPLVQDEKQWDEIMGNVYEFLNKHKK
jgi:hypothetical protein